MTRHGRDRVLVEGTGEGEVVVLDEPLSFWGGMDPTTGAIVDARHPQRGVSLSGKVVVMPSGRGSSSSSSVLAEAVRAGAAPAAILLERPDAIVALGAIVARELYAAGPPIVTIDDRTRAVVTALGRARIDASDGSVEIRPAN